MHKVLFRECILVRIRIRVDNEILIARRRIRTCPEEVFPLFGCSQFTGNPYVTIEHTLYFRRNIIIVLGFQHWNLTVHFGTSKEIDDNLSVFFDKLLERGFVRRLNSQDGLWSGINVLRVLKLGLCILVFVYLDNNNIADQLQCSVIVCRRSIHNTEWTFRLGQPRHIGIKHVIEGATCRTFPQSLVNHYQNFIRPTAWRRSKHTLLAITARWKQCEYQGHTQIKQVFLHISICFSFYKATKKPYKLDGKVNNLY